MKFDAWPKKKESPLANEDKESAKESEEDPKERVMCKSDEEEDPIEKGDEQSSSTGVKRRKTGDRNAYLAGFQ
jgi:hypothetical protein